MAKVSRYGKIETKNKREIVLLKSYPCQWGRCSFCDYTHDNSRDEQEMLSVNREALQNVTGEFGVLEIVNSGSVFELPSATLSDIRELIGRKRIKRVCVESYYGYKDRLHEIRDFFGMELLVKCGIETFDHWFRNQVLKKGIVFQDPREVAASFDSVCLLVGVKGQTKEMIQKDIAILLDHFSYGCINLYENNSTEIKADEELKQWFRETYGLLESYPNIDVLWTNTAFGIGEISPLPPGNTRNGGTNLPFDMAGGEAI